MKHLKWIIPVLIIIFCFLGFLIAPHDPEAMDIANKYAPFSAEFPLGTDQFGRCELSRLLYGGYVTLGIVLLGGGIVLVLGTLIGLWLGRANAARSLVFSSLGRCNGNPTFSLPYHFCRDMGKQHPYYAGGADSFSNFEDD